MPYLSAMMSRHRQIHPQPCPRFLNPGRRIGENLLSPGWKIAFQRLPSWLPSTTGPGGTCWNRKLRSHAVRYQGSFRKAYNRDTVKWLYSRRGLETIITYQIFAESYSHHFLFQGGFTGVCGVLSYRFEMDSQEVDNPHHLNIMWSVPYNLNSYSAYLAVGISHIYLNSTEGSRELFDQLYYYSGPFERATAGQLVEYSSESERGRI